ncbi:MAG: hypothetical protein WDW36_005292 [Sanguina aurantia]
MRVWLKEKIFGLDQYAYLPTLISAEYKTWLSVLTSIGVLSAWMFSVAFTLYLWMTLPLLVSSGELEHNSESILVPAAYIASKEQLGLPQIGVQMLLGNGSLLLNTAILSIAYQQVSICNGNATAKLQDTLNSTLCSFVTDSGSVMADQTISTRDCDSPRHLGTMRHPPTRQLTVSTPIVAGSVQLMIKYPYTGVNSLISGHFPSDNSVVWSRRETSLSYLNSTGLKQLQVAKLYLKLDDRDDSVHLTPYANLFDLFGAWGGFLSILMLAGTPAYYLNKWVWDSTVKRLILKGDIHFNENARMTKSHALGQAYDTYNSLSTEKAASYKTTGGVSHRGSCRDTLTAQPQGPNPRRATP